MNRNRLIIGLAAAVLIGLFLSSYVYHQLKNASVVRPPATQEIVVAAVPLQIGARLDSSNLRTISWPAGDPVPGMFTRIADCTNRALITPVAENEPILEAKLAPVGAGAGLPAQGASRRSAAVNGREPARRDASAFRAQPLTARTA